LIIWEHLGLLHEERYNADWKRESKDYLAEGFTVGKNLFTTRDDERGGLDATDIQETADKIRAHIP
jgi:hypothetical protein